MTIAMSDLDYIAGMTVNERLYHFGLIEAFDTAVESRQLSSVVEFLWTPLLSPTSSLLTGQRLDFHQLADYHASHTAPTS